MLKIAAPAGLDSFFDDPQNTMNGVPVSLPAGNAGACGVKKRNPPPNETHLQI
jgi:hypothetical protein